MRTLGPEATEELRRIAKRKGTLRAQDVVTAAKSKESALHRYFTWDQGKAAERWRLEEARHLIMRVRVHLVPQGKQDPVMVREFVSLPSDRRPGRGFRPIQAVMTNDEMREEMLSMALSELSAIRAKYGDLQELCGVVKEIDRLMPRKETAKRKAS